MENPKTLSEALCHIYKLRGANDLKDPAMLTAIFPDIAPKLKAERFLIDTLAKSGCLKKLAAADGLPTGEAASIIASAVAVLSQQYSIDPEKADVLCHTYINALRGKAYIPKSSGANGGKSSGTNGNKNGGASGVIHGNDINGPGPVNYGGGANGGKSGGANGGKSGGANGGKQTDPPPAAQQQGCGKGPVFILLLLAVFGILCGVFTGAGIPDPGYTAFLITGTFAIIIAIPLFSKKKK